MNCSAVDRWLDAGRPRDGRAGALAHTESCDRCAAALAAARDLDHALAQRFATASEGFTDSVMARLPARAPVRPATSGIDLDPVIPWWVQAVREPLTVGSFLVGILLLGFGGRLWDSGQAFFSDGAERIEGVVAPVAGDVAAYVPGPGWMAYAALLLVAGALAWTLFRLTGSPPGLRAGPR